MTQENRKPLECSVLIQNGVNGEPDRLVHRGTQGSRLFREVIPPREMNKPDHNDEGDYGFGLDEDYEPDEGGFDIEMDCGFMPQFGTCSKAGSEECDWECPMRDREAENE